jgi:hypothetical protein
MAAWGGGAGALDAGIHIGLIVVADIEHIVSALQHPRQGLEADVEGPAVAAEGDHLGVAPLGLEGRLHPRRNGAGILEQGVQPGHTPGGLRPGGGEDLQAAGGVGHHHIRTGGLQDQARGERRPAAGTGPMPGIQTQEAGLSLAQLRYGYSDLGHGTWALRIGGVGAQSAPYGLTQQFSMCLKTWDSRSPWPGKGQGAVAEFYLWSDKAMV